MEGGTAAYRCPLSIACPVDVADEISSEETVFVFARRRFTSQRFRLLQLPDRTRLDDGEDSGSVRSARKDGRCRVGL